ncbi:serine hydrolase domain-containing protein [Flagellimonas pacifica]|uniref:Beta-lactamase n=1 Tax=Flagellimonas pacifica TaxID=1247520 RepID=A0A285MYV1_9FLAO|nr:serine hydrolase domain-containing protein [Allomuricauda parva]SNZ00966.1 CubicO group peptidase, beta-lactamase class C family [Allomuricauda parva]
MNKYILLILLLTTISCNNKSKKSSEIKKETSEIDFLIDSVVTKMVNDTLINSISIGIYYNGKEYINHFGELEKGKGNTPNNKTIYEIGSLSKVFTGTIVANAVLEKKISVDDEINKYLNEEYPNLSYLNQPIKVKHLLTHTSGFPNMLPFELNPILSDFLNYDTPLKINKILKDYNKPKFFKDMHSIKIDTIPGFNYSYSSAGTELTAHILEEIYKTNYEHLLINFLSKKIGMKNTKITLNKYEMTNLAVGYHTDNSTITSAMEKLPWGASGNIKSTITDMMKFVKYQLANNDIVLESHRPLIQFNKEFGLSYFWNIDSSNEKLGKHYFHHGGVPRSQSYIYVIPKYNLGAFIITNQSGKNTAHKMKEVLNQIFDKMILEIK